MLLTDSCCLSFQPPAKAAPNNALGPAFAGLRTDDEFRDFMSANKGETAVVEFGTTWCAKCHEIFPTYYMLSRHYRRLKFALAQVDYMKEAAQGIRYSPTFAFYRNGRKVDEVLGKDGQKLADHIWLHAD